MKNRNFGLIVVLLQGLFVVLFFVTVSVNKTNIEKKVITVHNDNLNKIATSVSLLFKEEKVVLGDDMFDELIVDLPNIPGEEEEEPVVSPAAEEEELPKSTPLVSIDASKYNSYEAKGFKVTEGNKQYELNDYEFDVVVAVVAGEFDKNLDDALGVVSVILNRCDSSIWSKWFGTSPYSQVVAKGQFEVYFAGIYNRYMPGGANYGDSKYEIARQALLDGLSGIRNNDYLGFRAWWLSGYSDKYIVTGGNRYGYN